MADKICKICKLVFKVKLSHFNKRVCCSRLCLKEHYKISLLGNKNPNWRGGISVAESKCNYCGIDFKSTNYKPNYYCSRICQNRKQANDKKQQALERNKEKKPKIKKPFELKNIIVYYVQHHKYKQKVKRAAIVDIRNITEN